MPEIFNAAQIAAINQVKNKIYNKGEGLFADNERLKGFVNEKKQIDKFAAKKNPLIKEYINIHKEAEARPNTKIWRIVHEAKAIAAKQELYKRAATLCKNGADKEALMNAYRELNNDPAMIAYEKYIKGLRYLAGMDKEATQEVKDFFDKELFEPLITDDEELDPTYGRYRYEEADLGLSKEQKVLMDEYMRMVAKEKAREIYMKRFTHKFNSVQEQYIDDFLDPEAKSPAPFTGRSTPTVYCIGRMLMDGHDLKDIMDPRALKDAKKKIGQEYKDLYNRHDAQQYAENMYQCGLAIKAAVLNYIKEHKDEIKTPQDLAMHAEPLARLSMYCCDLTQELNKCVKHVKNVKAEDLLHLGNELERFMTIAGTGETGIIYYDNLEVLSPIILGKEITRQLSIKAFLEELQKDEPDIANLPSYDDNGSLAAQIATLSELNEWYYNSNVGINDPEDFNKEKIRVIGSMMSQDYLNKNNIRYDRPRVPASVKVKNEKTMSYPLEVGEGLSVVVSRGGEQLIETNVPARMDQYIRSLEKEDLRGKESGNSDQFNTMMRSFDESMGKLGDLKVDNPECLEEMAKLKEAALAYINAKRAQKGYEPVGMVPDAFDDQMLGKKKGGPSIFTSRGKERYEFAWKTIWRATEMERAIREKMQPKVEISNDNPIQNNPIQDNPIQNNEIQNNEIKDNQVQDIQIQNNQENELPKEEPKQPTEQKKTAPVEVEKNINPKYAKIKGILESWNEHVKEQQEETGLPLTLAGTVGEFETIAPELVDVQALGEILGYPDPVDVRGFNVDVVMRALAQKLPQIDMYVDNEMQKEDVQNEEMKKEELDDDFAFS